MHCKDSFRCPIDATISLIGGKYKALILWQLLEHDICRFNQLQHALLPVTPKMLTQQLRELEQDGLITRKVYPVVPPKVEYRLSELGISLSPVIDEMRRFGTQYYNLDIRRQEMSA